MNVPTIKLVCWLAALASAGGLAKYAHGWFGNIEQRQLPIDPDYVSDVLNEDLQVAPDVREIVDYDDLKVTFKTMNWTGNGPTIMNWRAPFGNPASSPQARRPVNGSASMRPGNRSAKGPSPMERRPVHGPHGTATVR